MRHNWTPDQINSMPHDFLEERLAIIKAENEALKDGGS
jgi:hypothetical protein